MRPFAFFSVSLALLTASCASSPPMLGESQSKAPPAPIAVQEAFSRSAQLAPGKGPDISVLPGQVPLVTIGSETVLAVPVTIDASRPWTVTVRSRIVQKSDGTYVLFFPVVTIVDHAFNITSTLDPTDEFNFSKSENILRNEFKLPIGTQRFLIHTTDKFIQGSFFGTFDPNPGTKRPTVGAFFGVIGAIVDIATYPAANAGANQYQYRFGGIGIIGIEAH